MGSSWDHECQYKFCANSSGRQWNILYSLSFHYSKMQYLPSPSPLLSSMAEPQDWGWACPLLWSHSVSVISLRSAWHWNRGVQLCPARRRAQVSNSWAHAIHVKKGNNPNNIPSDQVNKTYAWTPVLTYTVQCMQTRGSLEWWRTYHWKRTFLWSIDQGLP